MYKCIFVVLLASCLSGASPLEGPAIPAPVKEARDTEHDESTVATNTDLPHPELGPEVPDMLSGVTVNNTFLHKVDSDNDGPSVITAPTPELSTHRNEPDQTNLTDKVNSPRVVDPGTTHQEDSTSNKSSVILKAENTTVEESKNISAAGPKPSIDVNTVVSEAPAQETNDTVPKSTPKEEVIILPAIQNAHEKVTRKPELNDTKEKKETASAAPTQANQAEQVSEHPSTTQAPVHNETKPQPPPSGQVDVFSPPVGNETQNLVIGFQPHTSEQHADHLQLSGASDPSFLQPSQSAAILAGVFVVVALLGYVGLLVWRRLLEKKYGNREMLVNEDEFYDTSDLRHFEL